MAKETRKLKNLPAKAVAKKSASKSTPVRANAKKAISGSAMSAKSHQQDLARISGGIAQSKDKKYPNYTWSLNPYVKAETKTRKSFGLKNKRKSEY